MEGKHRNQYQCGTNQYLGYIVPVREEQEVRYQLRYVVLELGTSGAKEPGTSGLGTLEPGGDGARYPETRMWWCSVPQEPGTSGARYPTVYIYLGNQHSLV